MTPTRTDAEPVRPFVTQDRVLRGVVGLVLLLVGLWLLWYFARLVAFLLVGLVLAYLMRPLMYRLEGLGLGRITAIVGTFIVVLGTLSLLLTYLVPFLADQVNEIAREVSPERLRAVAADLEAYLGRVLPVPAGELQQSFTRLFDTLFQEQRLTRMLGSVVDLFTNLFYAVVVIPFITFFFLKDGTLIRQALLRRVPNRYFEVTLALVEKIETNLGRYFRALMVQCLSIATVATVLLYVAGLKYAPAVGLFTGLANTIPYFGPFLGFVAGTLVGIAQTGDFSLVPGVVVAMLLTQLADNVFFQPFIFSKAARTHPLVILFVVLIGAQLAGIVGMLLAIPVMTTLRVAAEQVWWSFRNYRILRAGR
ncbi:MAG: AI-2E family transporter [Bacteroidetes bacterium]|nr:MAG: AI-2E family transporter [Bacteroidota bacterium]